MNLKNRASIRNKVLLKAGFLDVKNRVRQLKMNHVFKIKNQTCPPYMRSNFNRLNENSDRMTTRGSAYNFFLPRVYGQGSNTFYFTAIKEWNALPINLKCIENENTFKEKLKHELKKEML